MPPYKVTVKCHQCPFARTGWAIKTGSMAYRHAQKYNHTLALSRDGKFERYIRPLRNADTETW